MYRQTNHLKLKVIRHCQQILTFHLSHQKKTENTSTILKLKRYTSTFILTIEPSHSLEDIKYQLCNIINNSGGLPAIQDLEMKNEDEEDIAVPKSEYIDDVDEIKEEVQDESAITKVLVDDIRVAYPKIQLSLIPITGLN